jgi:glycerophosphoryl diester phosphodiesterase
MAISVSSSVWRGPPIVIGHRGASGYVPEHTLVSYFIAIQQGADFIEPDLVATRDGILIARHENEIGGTTDVATHPEFAQRRTDKVIDGQRVNGWFTEDFTLAELKTLRARERIPELRAQNCRFDGQFTIPTFDEILALVNGIESESLQSRPRIGIYPETKHPSYFRSIGLPLEASLIEALEQYEYRDCDAPVFLQSFEVQNLKDLRAKSALPIIQLIEAKGAPYDLIARGDSRTYADLIKPYGLAEIATYATGIGVHKDLAIARNADGSLGQPCSLIADAHACGLQVHAWTFRAENNFLPTNFRRGTDPAAHGDLAGEIQTFLNAGLDAFFTDQPDIGVRAVASHKKK